MSNYRFKNVLVIDDNIIECIIHEHILHQSHIAEKVTLKYSGASALAYLKLNAANPKNLPDLIFLDLVMPEMDGFDFIKHFEKLDGIVHYYCSIIVLSSNTDYIDYQRSLQSPFVTNYLKKPLNIEELVQLATR